jgi:hypothetical protein
MSQPFHQSFNCRLARFGSLSGLNCKTFSVAFCASSNCFGSCGSGFEADDVAQLKKGAQDALSDHVGAKFISSKRGKQEKFVQDFKIEPIKRQEGSHDSQA